MAMSKINFNGNDNDNFKKLKIKNNKLNFKLNKHEL